MPRSLNVGCGPDIRPPSEGWVNMDVVPLPGVDVVHDILSFPWPFADATFDHVLMRHVLEHVPHEVGDKEHRDGFLLVVEELHRILKPKGRVEIFSPHHDSPDVWADPTHTRAVHPKNFQYFTEESAYSFYSRARFRTVVAETSAWIARYPHGVGLGKSGLPLGQHLGMRLPFLLKWLLRPAEVHIVIEKA